MTLIFILIALTLDFFARDLERFRDFSWLRSWYFTVENRAAHLNCWNGPLGVVGVLSMPMIMIILAILLFEHWHALFVASLTLILLAYCLAPEKLGNHLDDLVVAHEDDNVEKQRVMAAQLIHPDLADSEDPETRKIIQSAMTDAQQRTFGVIFWLLILGIAGAFLYRITVQLESYLHDTDSGFANSLRDLKAILEWPVSRLMVLGMALAAHMMDALNGWRKHEALSLHVNQAVLAAGGFGALQYSDAEREDTGKAYWFDELKGLLNRTLIIWLAVIAIMTLSGWRG